VAFDFEAYSGALWSVKGALADTARKLGLSGEVLRGILCRGATLRNDKWEASFWRHAYTKGGLGNWIQKEAGKNFDADDEEEMLRLAREIPARIRRNLVAVSLVIPAPKGGNPRKLDLFKVFWARREVRLLLEKRLSKANAYKKVADRMGVGVHTIRRECEPKERERSLRPKPNNNEGVVFVGLDPDAR
jgi:hypothetical protein